MARTSLAEAETQDKTGYERGTFLEVGRQEIDSAPPNAHERQLLELVLVCIHGASQAVHRRRIRVLEAVPVDMNQALRGKVLQQNIRTTKNKRDDLQTLLNKDTSTQTADRAKGELVHVHHALWVSINRWLNHRSWLTVRRFVIPAKQPAHEERATGQEASGAHKARARSHAWHGSC